MNRTKLVAVMAGVFLGLGISAIAQDETDGGRWVTYKVNSDSSDVYQIDRNSVQQEGPYTTYWVRIWDEFAGKPITDEYGATTKMKWAANCTNRKVGTTFMDTTNAAFVNQRKSLQQMTWDNLDNSVILSTVCRIK